MSVLAPGVYNVPQKIFFGEFSGENPLATDLDENFYIYGLTITNNFSLNNEHYSGLFSRLGAGSVVSDLNFTQSELLFSDTDEIFSYSFYMGAIAGRMINATIENVLVDVQYSLGNDAIGRTYLGGIVGEASGVLSKVASNGELNLENHSFVAGQAIRPDYHIGGIVGAASDTSKLRVVEAINNSVITGFKTTSDIDLASGSTEINVYIGGVIGYLKNSSSAIHELVYVSNKGDIYVKDVLEREAVQAYQYVGGVFGYLEGLAPILEADGEYKFANLYNEGDLYSEYINSTAEIKSAGIGISNTSEDTEFALMFNHGNFDYALVDSGDVLTEYASDLIISEYGEGDNRFLGFFGNDNRWIEIYNGTGESVSLSGYSLRYNSGSSTSWSTVLNLSGTIAHGDTYVIVDTNATSTFKAFADISSASLGFNGDDAVGLFYNGSEIDIFGVFAQDPGTGWTINGTTNATANHVVTRNTDAYQPTTSWTPSDWTVLSNQNTTSLGSYSPVYEVVEKYDTEKYDYTSLIYDVSTSTIALEFSRIYNYSNYDYNPRYFSKISPFVASEQQNSTLIKFSANNGNINYYNSDFSTFTATEEIDISAVTLNPNVSYLNFQNYGDISILKADLATYELYISGFSKYLSEDRYIQNSLNTGNITFADINGTGNIYVSGFVNFNNAGDLHEDKLIAEEGIINSINSGNISTTYSSTIYGINGLSNTFVGGLSTLNAGSIQDSANLGNLSLVNTNESGSTSFYESTPGAYEGGLIQSYSTGILAGGVSAVVLNENSRIYDSSNGGDVLVKTFQFSRAGGILGVSLWQEANSGGIGTGMGLTTSTGDSKLANGLNFGNVSAITKIIEYYETDPITYVTRNLNLLVGTFSGNDRPIPYSYSDTSGSEVRLPVHAVAGGVIGYGLSYMQNMLNHGTISSTDVAGGLVGATYVLGGSNSPETIVNISTAVNYGDIKSISTNSVNETDLPSDDFTIENISSEYQADGNSFIFPTGYTREGPRSKRGFGGVFGRLQRGNLGAMTAEGGSFNFIVNANPNIDLIGRVDQVGDFSNTVTAYRFNNSIYYSAKRNDTTQVVFTGFTYTTEYNYLGILRDNVYEIIEVIYLGYIQEGSTYRHEYYVVGEYYNSYSQQGETNIAEASYNYIDEEIVTSSTAEPGSNYSIGQILYNDNNNGFYYTGGRKIPWITEDSTSFYITDMDNQYIYDQDFPMRTKSNLTEYIYYAEYNLLADRFREISDGGLGTNVRNNGMYVLSTTAGQEFGAVLPRNIDTDNIKLVNEDASNIEDLPVTDFNLSDLVPSFSDYLDTAIIDEYQKIYQTRYNEKAILTDSELQDFALDEVDGSNTFLDLSAGEPDAYIDYANNDIYLTVSMEAFNELDASYSIYSALASANSLIAVRPEDFLMDDLIFTEYIEGSGSNQALEIYNGTASTIDLSQYNIGIYLDGSSTISGSLTLSGSLASGDTYVIAHPSANATILAQADLTNINLSYISGNDILVLRNGTTVIDSIGQTGVTSAFAQDVTMTRKLMLRDESPSDVYDRDYYWEVLPSDTFTDIGSYSFDLEALSELLSLEKNSVISTNYPAVLDITLPLQSIINPTEPLYLGSLSIYSEAFVNDPIFANTAYYNDYDIYITFTPNNANLAGNTGISSVLFNSSSTVNFTPTLSDLDIRSSGTVNANGSLRLNYLDDKGILTQGYDFKDFFDLYYLDNTNEVLVDESYYSVTSIPLNASSEYSITFDFSNAVLRSGDYIIRYSYFSTSTDYDVTFDKAPSTSANLVDLDYYSMEDLTIGTKTITSSISMGKIPSIDTTTSNFTANQNALPVYLDNYTYDISFFNSNSLIISSFSSVTSARLVSQPTYDVNGYLTYVMEYIITAEDETTSKTYTHTITERPVVVETVYKNGNEVSGVIETTREAMNTRFEIDLGFDQGLATSQISGPVDYNTDDSTYPYLSFEVTGVDFDLNPYTAQEIVGITLSNNSFLIIDMSYLTLPGDYTFTLHYHRTSEDKIVFSPFTITKNLGEYAYLENIKFTPIESESRYPTIQISDSFGEPIPNPGYEPSVYYIGIDYDGADLQYHQYFKVRGQVSNIPLESYYPYMLEYLPLGATIARYDADTDTWTNEVSINSDPSLKADLADDFTEVEGEENVSILYRVTSEDELHMVYYYVSVNDILYNLSLSFNIYYCTGTQESPGVCTVASETEDFNEVIQIKATSLDVSTQDYTSVTTDPVDPIDYPEFTHVAGIHNEMIEFIYTVNTTGYLHRFARNRGGFYVFDVILPRDSYLNELYTYEIKFTSGSTYTLPDISDYTYTFNQTLEGKYFYILPAEYSKSRTFDIYIYNNNEEEKPFGLFDFLRTWG
ncbi:MAG: lamin tail domain-containing protein [Candidatus Izemoplasmatales bacterium]